MCDDDKQLAKLSEGARTSSQIENVQQLLELAFVLQLSGSMPEDLERILCARVLAFVGVGHQGRLAILAFDIR